MTTLPDPDAELVAEAKLFPLALTPTTADAIAQYTHLISRLAPRGYADRLAAAHGRALGSNEPLAALLRSSEALEDVGAAAATVAQPIDREAIGVTQDRESASAIAKYKRAIAEQLAEHSGHPLAKVARAYLEARGRREQAEAEQRAATERAAAEQAEREAERQVQLQAERDRRAAEVAEVAARASSAEAAVEAVQREYLRTSRQWLVAELAGSGIDTIRIKHGAAGVSRGVYSVEQLCRAAAIMTADEIRFWSAALNEAIDRAEQEAAP